MVFVILKFRISLPQENLKFGLLIHFRIRQICFIADCATLKAMKMQVCFLITSKLRIFTPGKAFYTNSHA